MRKVVAPASTGWGGSGKEGKDQATITEHGPSWTLLEAVEAKNRVRGIPHARPVLMLLERDVTHPRPCCYEAAAGEHCGAGMLEILRPELSLWEIGLRGTIAWLGLVLVVRVVPKRNTGHISPNDMLVLVVIGALAADAVSGGATSTGDLLLMIVVVLLWSYVLDILEYRVPAFRRLMRPPQTRLVENGRMLRRNMRRELVTEEEIRATLRKEGIHDLSDVVSAHLEADGEISVLRK